MINVSIRSRSRILRDGGAVLLLLLAGCSSNGTITGKITYQGKPLPVGTVTFVPEQGGGGFTSDIRDGEYKLMKVPPGPMKIAVITPSESGGPPKKFMEKMRPPPEVLKSLAPSQSPEEFAPSSPASKPVPVPKKFHDPNTSGLTYTVKSGSQVHDIDLPAQ